ncbi:MAG: ABC transporter ATP-binding protein [Syntrophorhabdus sp.]|jgi:branched-chain amino acid transport system ATP-binding protein|nr:ABC transporter ATP-binding protein [Syntrophorhabdus sp.]
MILKAERLSAGYARIQVLKAIDLEVKKGEIVCLVGANGAGKSTLLKALSGVIPPTTGRFLFNGQDVTGRKPNQLVRIGLSHVPEGRQIFGSLTVKQNLFLGAYVNPAKKERLDDLLESVFVLFPKLKERLAQKAGTMSGGEQQMLAIGRGLMSQPKLLLLDEPSLGLAPLVVEAILGTIGELRSRGISILLVEQNVNAALHISDRAYVLETGRIVLQGKANDLLENEEVKRCYLGM